MGRRFTSKEIAVGATVVLAIIIVSINVGFFLKFGRLAYGGGELLNWAMGLTG